MLSQVEHVWILIERYFPVKGGKARTHWAGTSYRFSLMWIGSRATSWVAHTSNRSLASRVHLILAVQRSVHPEYQKRSSVVSTWYSAQFSSVQLAGIELGKSGSLAWGNSIVGAACLTCVWWGWRSNWLEVELTTYSDLAKTQLGTAKIHVRNNLSCSWIHLSSCWTAIVPWVYIYYRSRLVVLDHGACKKCF